VAREVVVSEELGRGHHRITLGYAKQSLVEGPVTKLAESHAVGGTIITAKALGFDV
jgi:hypothetical protein